MSGDRVDVLEAFDDLRLFAHPHLTAIEDFARFSNARARIAELIEAAEPFARFEYVREVMRGTEPREGTLFAKHSWRGSAELRVEDFNRLIEALRACRQDGAK